MKPVVKLCLYFSAISLLNSCAGIGRNPIFESAASDSGNLMTYSGMISCPDCALPNLVLKLKNDNTYEVEILHTKTGETNRYKGMYTWKKKHIFLKNDSLTIPDIFMVSENQLNPVIPKDETASLSALKLLQNTPEEKTWKLVELNGMPVNSLNDSVRYPHFTLKVLSGRIVGNGGCNSFAGHYEIFKGAIRISDLISTKMACMEVTYESKFFEAMEQTDNFLLRNDTLLLRKSENVLARLVNL